VLEALSEEPADTTDAPVVTDEHLSRALDDLLDSAQGVTRALLGVRDDGEDPSPRPAPMLRPHPHTAAQYFSTVSYGYVEE
jgi:hypothetical protein